MKEDRKAELSPILTRQKSALLTKYSSAFTEVISEWKAPRNTSTLCAMLCVIVVTASSTLVSPSKEAINKSLVFDGGALGLASLDALYFYLTGLVTAPIFGLLAGYTSRDKLILTATLIVGVSTSLCAFAANKNLFIWCRTMTGFGYGALLPVVMSIIGDWFSGSARQEITGYITAVFGIGTFNGFVLSHILKDHWQILFFVVGAVTTAAGFLYFSVATEPTRGNAGGPDYVNDDLSFGTQIKPLLGATNLAIFFNSFPGFIPFQLFMNSLDVMQPEAPLFLAFGFSMFIGSILGTWIGVALYKINTGLPGIYCSFVACFRIIPILLFLQDSNDTASRYIYISLIGLFLTQHSPILAGMMMSVNMPEGRGMAVSVCSSFEDLSRAVGPQIFVWFMNTFGMMGTTGPSVADQKLALKWSLIVWVVTGLTLMLTARSLAKDERNILALEDELTEAAKRRAERKESLEAIATSVYRTREVFKPQRSTL